MKQGITGKLIIILLTFSMLLIGAMTMATRWSFQQGFLDYLSEAELEYLDDTADRLAEAYAEQGSWAFVQHKHSIWESYLPTSKHQIPLTPQSETSPPQQLTPCKGMDGKDYLCPLPPPPREHSGLNTRLRLLDAEGNRMIGPPDGSGQTLERPIKLNGKLIGYLSLTPLPLPIAGIDKRFRDDQLSSIYPIAFSALLLAVILGVPIGRRMLRPIKAIASGAHKLAQGQFDSRIAEHGNDELGQLAHDFNGLASALERNEVLRRQGMADISHELRTPLALIRSEIEAMQDGIRPLNQPQLVKLHRSAQQLNIMVDDLYDLALTDAGALNYQKEDTDLADILRDATASAEYSVNKAGLQLETAIPSSLELFGDTKRLRQIIHNLLKNSRRYTDRNGTIRLHAWHNCDQVFFRIEDSAPGVDAELLPRLFERFYREESSRNRATGGAGLGLAICRNIVEAHQGSIHAECSELGGLSITVSLSIEG